MKQEFDMVKALHSLIYDLETASGQYNIGKMFSECLDKAANTGVDNQPLLCYHIYVLKGRINQIYNSKENDYE